ncbi:hypothetical protein PBI_ARISSANAE_42 [Mycobacterium phage Arissanae]|nr:hypothetical protein PBI_ARISSANAE_42 [Mycobacterium phage Arissanae]
MTGELRTAEKYVVIQPVLPYLLETEENVEMLRKLALLHMAGVGYVVEETFEMTVHERARIDGHVLPWTYGEFSLPDDAVLVRFTAFIDPYITEENTDG